MTDTELWDAVRQDDHNAFATLFDRYWPKIFGVAFTLLKDREASADIVHDLFLTLWIKRNQLNIESFSNYLKAAARYHVYKRLRTTKSIPLEYTDDELQSRDANFNSGEEKLRYLELENRLDVYLNHLPKRCREIFILSRKEHLSNEEIANRLGISKRTVENQITHALNYLRISLKDLSIILILLTFSKR